MQHRATILTLMIASLLTGVTPCEPPLPSDPHSPPPPGPPRTDPEPRPDAPDTCAGDAPDYSHIRMAVVADPGPGETGSSLHAYMLDSVDTSLEIGGHTVDSIAAAARDALAAMPQPVIDSVTRVLVVESTGSIDALPDRIEAIFNFENPTHSGLSIAGGTMYVNLAEVDDGDGPYDDEMRRTVQHEAAHLYHAYLEGFDRTYEAFHTGTLDPLWNGPTTQAWVGLARRQCLGTDMPYYAGRGEELTDEQARQRGLVSSYAATNELEDLACTVEDVLAGGPGIHEMLDRGGPTRALAIDKVRFLVERGFLCRDDIEEQLGLPYEDLLGLRSEPATDSCACWEPPTITGCPFGCYLDDEAEECRPCCYEARIGNYCNGPWCEDGACYGPWCVD